MVCIIQLPSSVTHKCPQLAKNAIAFIILGDGIPKLYYGQEQFLSGESSPDNRGDLWSTKYNKDAPLYELTATLNKLRNHAISVDDSYITGMSKVLYHDKSTYVTTKGPSGAQIISVLSNQGTNGKPYQLAVPNAAHSGTNLTEVFTCKTAVAGDDGSIMVSMDLGEPRVFFPTYQLNGTGLCGHSQSTTTQSSGSGTSTSSSASSTSSKDSGAGSLAAPYALIGMGLLSVVGLLL